MAPQATSGTRDGDRVDALRADAGVDGRNGLDVSHRHKLQPQRCIGGGEQLSADYCHGERGWKREFAAGEPRGCDGGGSAKRQCKTIPQPIDVSGTPGLSISKTHSGKFHAGGSMWGVVGLLTYKVTVSNVGNAGTTRTVTVTETAPTGFDGYLHGGAPDGHATRRLVPEAMRWRAD